MQSTKHDNNEALDSLNAAISALLMDYYERTGLVVKAIQVREHGQSVICNAAIGAKTVAVLETDYEKVPGIATAKMRESQVPMNGDATT